MVKSLRGKLVLTFISITLFSILFLGALVFNVLQTYLVKQLEFNLTEQVSLTRNLLETNWPKGVESLAANLKMQKQVYTRLTVIDAQGKVLIDSQAPAETMPNHKDRPEFASALQGKLGKSSHYSKTVHRKMLYIAQPIKQHQEVVGAVRLALPLDMLNRSLQDVLLLLFGAVLATLLISIFPALYLARHISTPILDITLMAKSIAAGNYGSQVKVKKTKDEISLLGRTFNLMSTKLKESLEEINQEKSKLETILYKIQDSIIVLDQMKRTQFINPLTEKTFQVSLQEVKGKSYLGLFRHPELSQLVDQVFATKKDARLSLEVPSPQRQHLEVFITLAGKDNQQLMIIFIRDMTKVHHLEQMRKEFVANVSHELKTPLTSILGFTETLLDENVDDQETQKRFLQIIKDEADRLLRLVNDLLSLSKIESSKPEKYLKKQPGNLADDIGRILKNFVKQADIANVHLDFKNLSPHLPLINYDQDALEQIMINLIDNSIKYTRDGGIVEVVLEDSIDKVKISIIDTGMGIPLEDLKRIFERFYRVDKARSRDQGGTGLGLSIVKHLVESHGGSVSVDSQVGKGSTFMFTLPK